MGLALLAHGLAGGARLLAQSRLDAKLDSLFAPYTGAATPGCVVGAAQGGRPLVLRAYGMADLEHAVPNEATTIFEAGSVTKQVTAAAVLLLGRQGRLGLDDDVRRWIPEMPVFAGRPITIRDLLHHTSGLRDWGALAALRGWPRGTATYTNAHVLDMVSRQRSLNFEPGAEFLYSNTNYDLLATVVQRASGRSLADYSQTNLFVPLGMTATSWRDDHTRIVRGRAVANARSADPRESGSAGAAPGEMRPALLRLDVPSDDAQGDTGLLTTVGDLLRWNEELATGAVLGPWLGRELEREGKLDSGRRIGYGAGVFLSRFHGMREIWHPGAIGGYRAFLARYPDRRVSLALLCNDGEIDPVALGHRVAELLLGRAASSARREVRSAPPPGTRALPGGLYRDERTAAAVRFQEPRAVGGQGSLPLLTVSSTEYVLAANPRVRLVTREMDGRSRPRLLWIMPDADTTVLDPVAPFDSATELSDYAGEWYSPELDATYTLAAQRGRLVALVRPDIRLELRPIYADAFAGHGLIFLFDRDQHGTVVGLGVWVARARNNRFYRLDH